MMNLFHELSQQCSKSATEKYSTSFCSAIKLLHADLRQPVFNIYGFVRFADEIVDTFHGHDKASLLSEFRNDTWAAIDRGISLNPILHSFQLTVNEYHIPRHLTEAFFDSMEMDLTSSTFTGDKYRQYIYGSAEVVGLMCLHIFCGNNNTLYETLKPYAQSLGAAFQKVNFLRDVKADYEQLSRTYFPGVDFNDFSSSSKKKIEEDIAADFAHAYEGILQLPVKARFGVYVAYKYYLSLFNKIKKTQARSILQQRIRIPNYGKAFILAKASLRAQLNIL